ncbi:MAG TPA: hypothetical protein VEQ11_15005 [Chloroflexota bacterium]|nr:hypothetical protein [Chloroflexota bacterium]
MPRPLGLGLPGQQWETWEPNELELAAALMPSAVVVLVYGDQPAETREAQVAAARALVARTGARLLLRACEPDVPIWASTDWAGECARRAGFFTRGGPLIPIEMIPGNELDGASEGGSLAWAAGAGPSWLLRFAQRYRRLRPGERLHLPAPSPGTEVSAFWQACARAGVSNRFDVADVHAYSDEQVRTLPRLAHEMLGLPVDLTECDQVEPALVAAEVRAYPWLGSACYSIRQGHRWATERPDLVAAFQAAQIEDGEPSALSNQELTADG